MTKAKKAPSLPVLKTENDERSKYDWATIMNEYVYGIQEDDGAVVYPKPKDLEARHNVPAQYISNRATKEKWVQHKEAHQREEALARQKEHQKRLAKRAVKFDETAADAASTAMQILHERLKQIRTIQILDIERQAELIEDLAVGNREVDSEFRSELKPLYSTYEIESIAKSMGISMEVAHKALGIEDGKPAINNTIQIANIAPSQALQEADEHRQKALESFFQNKNVRIPQFGLNAPEDDILNAIEAEIVEDTDEYTESQPDAEAEVGGPVHDPHTTPGSADRTESE
jgi:hypothetical protein